ncbi:MAG: proteasome assembly chaperone family protein [Methermicoccaceae archaeon]
MDEREQKSVRIHVDEIHTEKPVLVEGFPGIGLIGNIVSQHLVHSLSMKHIGTVVSEYFPPIAIMVQGMVSMPVRIYESEENGLITILSDIPITPESSYYVASAIVDWCESIGAREVLSIAGVATMGEEQRVFGAATTHELLQRIEPHIERFEVGSVAGVSGSLLTECYARGVPALAFLGETHARGPDPRAAAHVVETINKVYGLSVDTEALLEQAEQIETELHKLAEQVDSAETSVPPKREFPIYG